MIDVEEVASLPGPSAIVNVRTTHQTITVSQISPTGSSVSSAGSQKEGSAKGKREAPGPIVTTSDEEEISPPNSPRKPPTVSPTNHDHDYENIGSPGGSSTASGPTYIRQPGFSHHAHTVAKSKKKKTAVQLLEKFEILSSRGYDKTAPAPVLSSVKEPSPPQKARPRREPVPMRMRALPQSFWQQPNVPHNVSPAQSYPVLPPLFTRDGEEVQEVRPVSPSEDKERGRTTNRQSERKVSTANTELLFKLFEVVEHKNEKQKSHLASNSYHHIRRPRHRKIVPVNSKTFVRSEDPFMVDSPADKLFPQLTLEQGRATLHVMTIRGEGGKPVSLPSLNIEQNYSAMLSELVANI